MTPTSYTVKLGPYGQPVIEYTLAAERRHCFVNLGCRAEGDYTTRAQAIGTRRERALRRGDGTVGA